MTTHLKDIKPIYPPTPTPIPNSLQKAEPAAITKTIQTLHLRPHIEGGYFVETDKHPLRIPNIYAASTPVKPKPSLDPEDTSIASPKGHETRAASSSIQYLLTPGSPVGTFHLNKSRTVHTLHYGRARYVIIHADLKERNGGKAPVETFVVGGDMESGERLVWVVPGGKYKGCFLLPGGSECGMGEGEKGLLISETVVPGFEWDDHEFLRLEKMEELLKPEEVEELKWMLKKVD